jgi:hypothetical protein
MSPAASPASRTPAAQADPLSHRSLEHKGICPACFYPRDYHSAACPAVGRPACSVASPRAPLARALAGVSRGFLSLPLR